MLNSFKMSKFSNHIKLIKRNLYSESDIVDSIEK